MYNRETILQDLLNANDTKISLKAGQVYYIKPEWLEDISCSTATKLVLQKSRPMMIIGTDIAWRHNNLAKSDILMAMITSNCAVGDFIIPLVINGMVSFIDPMSTLRVPIEMLVKNRPHYVVPDAITEVCKYIHGWSVSGEKDPEIDAVIDKYQKHIMDLIRNGTLTLYRDLSSNVNDIRDIIYDGKFRIKNNENQYIKCEELSDVFIRNPNYVDIGEEPSIEIVENVETENTDNTDIIGSTYIYMPTKPEIPVKPHVESEAEPVFVTSPQSFNSLADALLKATLDTNLKSDTKISYNTILEPDTEKKEIVKKNTKSESIKSYQVLQNGSVRLKPVKQMSVQAKVDYLTDCIKSNGKWVEIGEMNNSNRVTCRAWAIAFIKDLQELGIELPEDLNRIMRFRKTGKNKDLLNV